MGLRAETATEAVEVIDEPQVEEPVVETEPESIPEEDEVEPEEVVEE